MWVDCVTIEQQSTCQAERCVVTHCRGPAIDLRDSAKVDSLNSEPSTLDPRP